MLPSPAPGEAVSSESAVCEQDGPGALLGGGGGEGSVGGGNCPQNSGVSTLLALNPGSTTWLAVLGLPSEVTLEAGLVPPSFTRSLWGQEVQHPPLKAAGYESLCGQNWSQPSQEGARPAEETDPDSRGELCPLSACLSLSLLCTCKLATKENSRRERRTWMNQGTAVLGR